LCLDLVDDVLSVSIGSLNLLFGDVGDLAQLEALLVLEQAI
jgi:hypothetical protein